MTRKEQARAGAPAGRSRRRAGAGRHVGGDRGRERGVASDAAWWPRWSICLTGWAGAASGAAAVAALALFASTGQSES